MHIWGSLKVYASVKKSFSLENYVSCYIIYIYINTGRAWEQPRSHEALCPGSVTPVQYCQTKDFY